MDVKDAKWGGTRNLASLELSIASCGAFLFFNLHPVI
jgi:hypothetical protein